MTMTSLDIDDELLAAAMKRFGTKTKRDTVNAALAEAARQESAKDLLAYYDDNPDATDPALASDAWHRPEAA
jgi:Arc/MetJ family transcription regulator